ncbi:MAG: substrate-binding domain-containing protein [Thermomicrobiales bacterium]|nr:substrate-binding domain-containing protein [Thermomicrobiales bacterium]
MAETPVDRLMRGRLSRRSALRGAAAASLAVPALSSFLPAAMAQDETYQVAYLTPGLNVPFWKYLSDGIKQQAAKDSAETGATITVTDYDSRNDAGTQLQNAQDAITAGVNLIILSPTDSSSAPTVLEAAQEAGVPVVIADIGTDEGEYVSFVISSNEQGAYEAGKVMMEKMKEKGCEGGDVLMITISQARLNGQNRTKGITRAVEEAGSKIVQFLQSEDYTRQEAQAQASDMLSANPEACGFFTQHDEAALGALTAIEESGRADDIVFASFDGSPESVELIKQGKLVAASMQQPVLMGRISMEVGLKALRGEEVEKETEVPTILVTPENVNDIEATLQDTVFPVEGGAEATPAA